MCYVVLLGGVGQVGDHMMDTLGPRLFDGIVAVHTD